MTKIKTVSRNNRITDRVSTPLLTVTFVLALFISFGGAELMMRYGVSEWIPTGLLLTAVLSVLVQLAREPAKNPIAIRETAATDKD